MKITKAKVSPGKGRFPKSQQKKAMRRYQLGAGKAWKDACANEGGMYRSRGAASEAINIDRGSSEFAEIQARFSAKVTET